MKTLTYSKYHTLPLKTQTSLHHPKIAHLMPRELRNLNPGPPPLGPESWKMLCPGSDSLSRPHAFSIKQSLLQPTETNVLKIPFRLALKTRISGKMGLALEDIGILNLLQMPPTRADSINVIRMRHHGVWSCDKRQYFCSFPAHLLQCS